MEVMIFFTPWPHVNSNSLDPGVTGLPWLDDLPSFYYLTIHNGTLLLSRSYEDQRLVVCHKIKLMC